MTSPVAARAEDTFSAVPDVPLPVSLNDDRISTPAVLIDLAKMDANIDRMARLARSIGASLRPHAKSHKSAKIAARQIAAGAVGVCCSTVGEAAALFAAGVEDITLAYPVVGRGKLDRLAQLARQATALKLVADSIIVARGYASVAQIAERNIEVLIEVDTGMRRSGASAQEALSIAEFLASEDSLNFGGILTHAGHAHDASDHVGIAQVARNEAARMRDVRDLLESHGFPVPVVSAGSSITAPHFRAGDGITEIRPGTYIYNDMRTLSNFACTTDQIAVSVLTTIVSLSDERIIVDAGSKTLTMTKTEGHGYGYLPDFPDAQFERLSEEHGVILLPNACNRLKVGDRVEILPIHVCVCVDLQREVFGIADGHIVERIPVEGFRRSN
ncbi:MAG TPA: alanine racemase [Micromonosporaceae bacterium]|nr:alanine racemase [Micromonosporaceae bacterium]